MPRGFAGNENLEMRSKLNALFISIRDLAPVVGVHPVTISRWLLVPLTPVRTMRINDAVEKIIKKRSGGGVD